MRLTMGGAFVIPPQRVTQYADITADLQLLEVTLPGHFTTTLL